MRTISKLALAFCLIPTSSFAAQIPEEVRVQAETLRDAALEGTHAFEIVRSLTVEVGPRLAGSEGDRKAVQWAVRTMVETGFDRVWTEEVTVPHWVRGEAEGEIVSPFSRQVTLVALGGSIGTPEQGIEAPIVEVPSVEALEELPDEEVAGRIVFFSRRMQRKRTGEGYGTAVGIRSKGPAVASAKGAVAVVIRSVGTDNNRIGHTGGMRTPEGARPIPAAALSNPDADLLMGQLRYGEEVRFRLRITSRRLPDAISANVIGEIRGSDRADEIVLLAAHLDSWDLGDGALDDGAGCAIVLETARRLIALGERPRRTLRVVLYANEEFGLSGGKAYAEKHAAEIASHVIAAESDLGSGPVWSFATRVAESSLALMDEIAALIEPLGVERGDNESYGGADISPLRKKGVPVVSLFPDATLYFDVHHTANDTLDKVDRKHIDQSVAAWLAFTWPMLQSDIDLAHLEEEKEVTP